MKSSVHLNRKQLDLLKLITKYRYVTVAQVQQYLNLKSRTSTNKKLEVLVSAQYLGKRFDKSYIKRARPAAFYALPKTLKELHKLGEAKYITEAMIRTSYNDKIRSENFIDDHQAVFWAAQTLERTYPGMVLYTSRQLSSFAYFPEPLPELYGVHAADGATTRYFIFHFDNHTRIVFHVRQINSLITYATANTYENSSGNDFPDILAICDTPSIERTVQQTFRRAISNSPKTPQVYTTSTTAIASLAQNNAAIWSNIVDSDTLVTLDE